MVVVCARSAGWPCPDTGARDQYMPEEGAEGTSGADVGEARGGKATYLGGEGPRCRGWGRAAEVEERWVVERVLVPLVSSALAERSPPVLVPVPMPLPVAVPGLPADAPVEPPDAGPGLLAIAEVDRRAVGRRPVPASLIGPDRGVGLCWSSAAASPFSRTLVFRMLTGGGPLGDWERE